MYGKDIGHVILILSPSIVLVALGMDIIIPCIPAIAETFSARAASAQWVLSMYFFGTGIGQLIIGPLADHYGRRKAIFFSVAMFTISSLGCALASELKYLVAARFIQGMSACGATVVVMAVIRDIYEDTATSKAYSFVQSVTALAPIFAPMLGGYMLVWLDKSQSKSAKYK